ncbi:hypothetical protein ACLOJK_040141 [Asimina triloba]
MLQDGAQRFHDVFQLKHGSYSDIPADKISEVMKLNSLDTTSTQTILNVVNGILDESIERKNGEVPPRNNMIKAREEKYQSRIKVLETLASGTSEETQVIMNQLEQMKVEKAKMEEGKKLGDQDVVRLTKEKENSDVKVLALKEELEIAKKGYEERCLQFETQANEGKTVLEEKLKEVEILLMDSRNKNKELQAFADSKVQSWKKTQHVYQNFIGFQCQSLQELKLASKSIKKEIVSTQKGWRQELHSLGNIRVYCRIRPFLPGQIGKLTTIEYIGENGELLVSNPSKPGKDGHRMFKFNKVFGPTTSQEEVFLDTQPLIRSVLDGYNVCIFAYGQTGSGKTYTMVDSILTVHVRGVDLETGVTLRGSLHLVDLAGSERVDRSEATGDRLREAQHINKSLSALGDVIFALAQKSSHVPYRNSKLTQVLQSSLGGQAKTLMFVQLNPDVESYSETVSTLKFAERVSGVELGAARSNKEGKDVRDLMEQGPITPSASKVSFLKETIAKKDDEIVRLQALKDQKNQSPRISSEMREPKSLRRAPSSPGRLSPSSRPTNQNRKVSRGRAAVSTDKAGSDMDYCSEPGDRHSEAGSRQSLEDFRHQKEFLHQSSLAGSVENVSQEFSEDVELLGFGDGDSEERLSDISDGVLSMGTETDGSICSVVEFTLFPEVAKPADTPDKDVQLWFLYLPKLLSRIPRPPPKPAKPAGPATKLKSSTRWDGKGMRCDYCPLASLDGMEIDRCHHRAGMEWDGRTDFIHWMGFSYATIVLFALMLSCIS